MNLEISSFSINIDKATHMKCTTSLVGADKFFISSKSEIIKSEIVDIININHCLSKKPCSKKIPNKDKINKGIITIPAPFGTITL